MAGKQLGGHHNSFQNMIDKVPLFSKKFQSSFTYMQTILFVLSRPVVGSIPADVGILSDIQIVTNLKGILKRVRCC